MNLYSSLFNMNRAAAMFLKGMMMMMMMAVG
jgi:hypothetical protein